jgi:beta-phosphoglucomutase
MIKLILFDLDGVLIDAKDIHYRTLNSALGSIGNFTITSEEHLNIYDGHKTRQKLNMLSKNKGLPLESHDFVYNRILLNCLKV